MVRLYAPLSYQSATEDEKAGICNGCGSKKKLLGIFGVNVPDKFWGLSIEEACNIHDWMYEEGWTEEHREHADEWFFKNMELLINQGKWGFLRKLRMKDAKGYYLAVRKFGGYAFNYTDPATKAFDKLRYKVICEELEKISDRPKKV